jgi:hypothetical protein
VHDIAHGLINPLTFRIRQKKKRNENPKEYLPSNEQFDPSCFFHIHLLKTQKPPSSYLANREVLVLLFLFVPIQIPGAM